LSSALSRREQAEKTCFHRQPRSGGRQ
jgi:hypothetical protein